jgi:hypothetical protein
MLNLSNQAIESLTLEYATAPSVIPSVPIVLFVANQSFLPVALPS